MGEVPLHTGCSRPECITDLAFSLSGLEREREKPPRRPSGQSHQFVLHWGLITCSVTHTDSLLTTSAKKGPKGPKKDLKDLKARPLSLQEYLACKKTHRPRTLLQAYTQGPLSLQEYLAYMKTHRPRTLPQAYT